MKNHLKHFANWRPGKLLRNTLHASGWNIVRILLQAGSLVLMTRVFGARGYGALAGVTALYITLAQFVGLGSGVALVRHLARNGEDPATRMLATRQVYLGTGILAFLLAWPCSIVILGGVMPISALACLAAAELIVAPTVMPFAYWHQARENMFASGAMLTLAPIARICAVTTAALYGTQELATYAVMHLIWLTSLAMLPNAFGNGAKVSQQDISPVFRTIREGLPYAVSGAAITAGNELDKTILLRAQGEIVTGQYTAAYRIMQAASLPVNSLILAAAPRMFQSATGTKKPLLFQLLIAVVTYTTLASLALAGLSPFIHLLLGHEFSPSEPLLRVLCLVLVTNCIRQLITAQLTASDKQMARNMAEIAGLAASIILLLILTPSIGAWGAIVALAASDLSVIALGIKSIINPSAKPPL